jgi:hypothetical protein
MDKKNSFGKKRKKFTDEEIHASLTASAPIENHYVYFDLVHHCTKNGQVMLSMIDDEDFNYACIKYLEKQGIPNFDDSEEEEQKYRRCLQSKVKSESIK